jgi:hypothetical protein
MSMADDDRILPDEVADGTVPDPDLATTEVGAKVDADEADLLEQKHDAVTEEDLEAEEFEVEAEDEG